MPRWCWLLCWLLPAAVLAQPQPPPEAEVAARSRAFAEGQLPTSQDSALEGLIEVEELAAQSQLYAPHHEEALALESDTALRKHYLQRQLARVQVLASYAQPYLSKLPVKSSDAVVRGLGGEWRATVHALHLHSLGRPGPVTQLEALFTGPLPAWQLSECREAPPEALHLARHHLVWLKPAHDLFSQRRHEIVVQAVALPDRCSAIALELYRRLAERFNRELAGRAPFAAPEPPARAANPETMKAFLDEYKLLRQELHQLVSLWLAERAQGQEMLGFLNALDGILLPEAERHRPLPHFAPDYH